MDAQSHRRFGGNAAFENCTSRKAREKWRNCRRSGRRSLRGWRRRSDAGRVCTRCDRYSTVGLGEQQPQRGSHHTRYKGRPHPSQRMLSPCTSQWVLHPCASQWVLHPCASQWVLHPCASQWVLHPCTSQWELHPPSSQQVLCRADSNR